jgi:hypothetical protein
MPADEDRVGIVGYGRIGRRTAALAAALVHPVLVFGPLRARRRTRWDAPHGVARRACRGRQPTVDLRAAHRRDTRVRGQGGARGTRRVRAPCQHREGPRSRPVGAAHRARRGCVGLGVTRRPPVRATGRVVQRPRYPPAGHGDAPHRLPQHGVPAAPTAVRCPAPARRACLDAIPERRIR